MEAAEARKKLKALGLMEGSRLDKERRGVTWSPYHKKWKVRVGQQHIGYFDDQEKAVECARKARELLGVK